MPRKTGRSVIGALVAGAALSITLASLVAARAPRYEIEILPPLETSQIVLPNVVGVEMNDSGQVVGHAYGRAYAAFRFTPGLGMQNLDPRGGANSAALFINENGTVFGEIGHSRPFLYSDENGFDLIDQRTARFSASDLNDRGELIGTTRSGRPFIYSSADGWLDLSDLSPLFRKYPTFARLINNDGDMVFTVTRPPGTQESFVLLEGNELVALGDFGFPMNVPSAIGRFGVVGLALKATGPDASFASRKHRQHRAYYFSPEFGVRDIHAAGYRVSFARWIQSEGRTVGGTMTRRKRGGADTIFTYDSTTGRDIRASKRQLKRFVRRHGGKFKSVEVVDMNDNLEFVGWARSKSRLDAGGSNVEFLSRPGAGLVSLQDIVDKTGAEARVERVEDINNRGQILVEVELPDGRRSAAVLTPSN